MELTKEETIKRIDSLQKHLKEVISKEFLNTITSINTSDGNPNIFGYLKFYSMKNNIIQIDSNPGNLISSIKANQPIARFLKCNLPEGWSFNVFTSEKYIDIYIEEDDGK